MSSEIRSSSVGGPFLLDGSGEVALSGTGEGVRAGPPTTTPPTVLGVQPQYQSGNGCGTTSLAMALSHVLGRHVSQAEVDADIRLADIYTSASNIRSSARRHGIEGQLVNNLTDAEVIAAVDQGRPILFLTDLTPRDSGDVAAMHWRVIDGYQWRDGKLQLHIADPWGSTYWRSWDSLQAEWADMKAVGLDAGYNRFGVILGASASDRALGPDRMAGVWATEPLIDATSDVVNDAMQIGRGKIWHVFSLIWNAVRSLFSFLLLPFQLLFGNDDKSDGKTATPPPTSAPAPEPARTERHEPLAIRATGEDDSLPRVVRALPREIRRARDVRWAEPDPTTRANALAMVQGPVNTGASGALQRPGSHT